MRDGWSEGWPHTRQQYANAILWAAGIGATIGLVGPFIVYLLLK